MKWIIGVDEAGRGPLAGPVSVGALRIPESFKVMREFPGLADSKQLTPLGREKFFALIESRAKQGDLAFAVRNTSAERIDRWGLALAVRRATARAVRALAPSPKTRTSDVLVSKVRVLLDGSLYAPSEYTQQTIIGGDEAVPVIALASIVAKVTRDRAMERFAKEFPHYGFEVHKGYGTKAHYAALKKYGLSVIHRRSFIHLDLPTREE